VWISPQTNIEAFELDEIFWFIRGRKAHESGVNTYIMTMVSRIPRQILAFEVDSSVKSERIQEMVDRMPLAQKYFTDGGMSYLDVDFWGRHHRNIRNKNDTYTIEGSNADIRHYIAGLRRRSRCFFRSLETLKAVLTIFIDAYNRFGEAKREYKERHPNFGRDFPFNHLQFI
jgi:IS1 family transposase